VFNDAQWEIIVDSSIWFYRCSNCHEKPLKNRWDNGDALSEYCPHCGKKMKPPKITEELLEQICF